MPPVANPATVFDALRIVMRPVHQPAEIVPLVHPSHTHAVTHPERYAFGEINIVRNEQRPAITDIDNEALVA